jgi:hypothetical protein
MENIENEEEKQVENEEIKEESKKKIWPKVLIIVGIIIVLAIIGVIVYATVFRECEEYEPYTSSIRLPSGEEVFFGITEDKPIIYLYPEKTTEVTVKLGKPEKLTCSYPKYTTGWNVIAEPDGTLVDTNTGRRLYSLYWEGIASEKGNFKEGFVVKGDKTIEFLEEKLEILGLNEFEAEEFIVYWLPKLESNKYNYIRFATMEEINKNMPLEFSVEPDTIIRVLMQYKGLDKPIEVKEQELVTPERNGFAAVEWGGSELK